MLAVFFISLREYLEIFLIIGIFLGLSKRLGIGREKEIITASLTGIALAFLIPLLFFLIGNRILPLSEENADTAESILMVISGVFIAYVIFSLHDLISGLKGKAMEKAQEKLRNNIFDISLFLSVVFFIVREGFEIALFTSTASLLSIFLENAAGLAAGLLSSAVFGLLTFTAYIKLPVKKIFTATEWLIALLGAAMVANGVAGLFEKYAGFDMADIVPIRLGFLPDSSTYIGHLIKNLTGIQREFGLLNLAIILLYLGLLYLVFLRSKRRA